MVVGEASIHNIMGGMESTGGVRLHNHKRKLKQRFDIIKKLGQGTYGKVQLGINKETGQEVAIKTIKKCKIETEADLIRIRREIQIMSSVQHPNIIHIYEVFENREKMVLVMEYAAGGELYDYLSERKVLSEHEARRIFRQISTAVFYCHKHKICHRDLKLENILLDQIGNAKIADFGLSNVFDEQRLLSTFCGSPLYASPEIVKGTPYHGPEVDCWSLGVLLYTLVYGAMPFDGSNFKRLVKQISQSDYFEPKKPSPASPLIKDMLTVCPARRADIEKICTHWWVNEGYDQNCLDIAEDLAAQTPVRLDLLLSLVPQSASAEKLVVGDQQSAGDAANNMSAETLVPTRCHSVGSLMELDQNNSDRRIKELVEEDSRTGAAGDAKRKLELTPSMDENVAAGVKRKERSRRKERTDEREPRQYRSGSRHHSAPIPNPIREEAMEVDPTAVVTVPTSLTVDLHKAEDIAACLELIEESKEKSPSKERSKTPVAPEAEVREASPDRTSTENKKQAVNDVPKDENKRTVDQKKPTSKSPNKDTAEKSQKSPEKKKVLKKTVTESSPKKEENEISKSDVPNTDENVPEVKNEVSNKVPTPEDVEKGSDAAKENRKNAVKKLKEKAMSIDSELSTDSSEISSKPMERRKSKIFETAEKFNQLAATGENEKPKKIFIPGVNVGGAKRAFERKASLSSVTVPQTVKPSASKVIIEVPADKKEESAEDKPSESGNSEPKSKAEKLSKREEEKKRAVDIITGAIGKPPMLKKMNGSPPNSPQNHESQKLGLKVQIGPNDVRNATVSVSTPVDTKFPFELKPALHAEVVPDTPETADATNSVSNEPKKSSKMEITLKSATLPRPRKTSKAEITLSGVKSPEHTAFKSEVEAKIDAFHPQKLRTQRSEVAFPVAAAVPQANRSSSLEPEGKNKNVPKERIIPIQVESGRQQLQHASTPPPKPPMPQRSLSQRSGSLSRQSTADSDTDSALGSTVGPEPIRKSPREYIIPIAVEGGGYVTPRSGSVEPESKTSTPTSTTAPRSRFGRPRRMSSLLSDASEDESPFSTLHRDSDDLLQRHMHRLRSSRPTRQPPEHADSLSSGEDDDDDGFELLTAENLFSTLLSRVRSLTQRLNVDDNRSGAFPSCRLLGRLGSNSPQGFWGIHEPLSRRLSESQFRRSMSRDNDRFARKEPSTPGTPNSPGARSTPSRDSLFEMGSKTLPRDKAQHENTEAEASQIQQQAQETLEQNFTPSLARRLSRQFIEQTRQSLPRSPSIPRDKNYQSPTQQILNAMEGCDIDNQNPSSTTSDQTEYRGRSADRNIRRSSSLLDPAGRIERYDRISPRRSVSLFDDEDKLLPPLPRQVMTLGRKYRDNGKSNSGGVLRESFHNYRTEKIQEEPTDDSSKTPKINVESIDINNVETGSVSECNSESVGTSENNLIQSASSVSAKSSEVSPTASTSNMFDYNMSYKSDSSRDFENRLLAAENLIKESKLKNLGPLRVDMNLSSSYRDMDKCDKESLGAISETTESGRRRSYIPSLRMRSGSLTREHVETKDRRKSYTGSHETMGVRAPTPERSILSKFFRPGSSRDGETKDKQPKSSGHRRISRFLRPDFFDTPREESQYVKEKEAQKAAENERRKSRFIRKKHENKAEKNAEGKASKELKNEANSITKEKSETSFKDDKSDKDVSSISEDSKPKFERQTSKNSFLHSLEKKLEKFRSGDEAAKVATNNGLLIEQKIRSLRENSAPPEECLSTESGLIKRAVSVEDLSLNVAPVTSPRGKVNSVLGLFRNIDAKTGSSGMRPPSMLSKLRINPYRGSRSDTLVDADTPSTSKIPTKAAKSDTKPCKKTQEEIKALGKMTTESKKSPPKEKVREGKKSTPERRSESVKKPSPEKVLPVPKKGSPEKVLKEPKKGNIERADDKEMKNVDKDTDLKNGITEKVVEIKTGLLEKVTNKKDSSPDKVVSDKSSSEKVSDNSLLTNGKPGNSKNMESEEKPKKSINSLSSIVKNGTTKNADKSDEAEKKVKKVIRVKESTEKEGDGTKKKKIIRVVKKVVKKSSDSSESKSESKDKPSKTVIKKSSSSAKEKKSDTLIPNGTSKTKDSSPEIQGSENITKTKENSSKNKADANVPKLDSPKEANTPSIGCDGSTESTTKTIASKSSLTKQNSDSIMNKPDSASSKLPEVESDKSDQCQIKSSGSDSTTSQPKPLEIRANRNSLKLDLSKIPQHSFRVTQPSRKESIKPVIAKTESTVDIELPKLSQKELASKSNEDTAKLIQNLSKITHHANITGNKIIIDKPLCAKDVDDLRREAEDSCSAMGQNIDLPRPTLNCKETDSTNASNIEPNEIEENIPKCNNTTNGSDAANNIPNTMNSEEHTTTPTKRNANLNMPLSNPNPIPPPKESPNDNPEDMFSPTDDTESFDSWSICSADMNHTRSELASPTSPTFSPTIRGDQPESIIDRIRRKSFYSRFNDRKRKTSLTAPPPGVTLPASSALSRISSLNRSKEKEYDKLHSYVSPTRKHLERSHSLYNEDIPSYRRSPIDRDRYSDIRAASPYSSDLRWPHEQHGYLSSTYDPVRKYARSPILDSSSARTKYYGSDYGTEGDSSSYRSPLSSSLRNESPLDSYLNRSSSTLPRKYGSGLTSLEPRSTKYYEELLAPSKSDYLTARKSPMIGEYTNRYENGYHNGNLDSSQFNVDKWSNHSDKMAGTDLTETNDGRLGDQIRGKSETISESNNLPSTSSGAKPRTSTTE